MAHTSVMCMAILSGSRNISAGTVHIPLRQGRPDTVTESTFPTILGGRSDIKNASKLLGISWNQAHHIMNAAVKRGIARKKSTPIGSGIDEKSYGKHHRYMTIVYNLDRPGVEHIEFDGKRESMDRSPSGTSSSNHLAHLLCEKTN
ncbi:MAG: hypothetical protein ACYCT2_00850 [Thermoplasmataceae archaeon]